MPPTDQQLATLTAFHKWTKQLFGAARPVFSCKHHQLKDGGLEINRGTMKLQFHPTGAVSLYDYSQGCCMVVCDAEGRLEEVLMRGLEWSIRRSFHETYPS